jgi:hypothetical protein
VVSYSVNSVHHQSCHGGVNVPHNKFVILPHRSRKRKQEEEEEYDDEDIDKNGEDEYDLSDDEEDLQSDAVSSDDKDEFIGSEGDNRAKPVVHSRYFWNKPTEQSSFQTVDGVGKLFRTSWWRQGPFMPWDIRGVLANGQRALVWSKQKKRTITLEREFGSRSLKLTQVPYRELTIIIFICFITLIFKPS